MATPVKKWPTYALGALEETLVLLAEIERAGRRVQDALANKQQPTQADMELMVLASDIRVKAQRGMVALTNGRNGARSE